MPLWSISYKIWLWCPWLWTFLECHIGYSLKYLNTNMISWTVLGNIYLAVWYHGIFPTASSCQYFVDCFSAIWYESCELLHKYILLCLKCILYCGKHYLFEGVWTLKVQGSVILVWLGQCHGHWCPGSFRRQVIGYHDVDHERVDPCFTQGGISAACVMLMWLNVNTCLCSLWKNLACKGLISNTKVPCLIDSLCPCEMWE